MLNILNIPGYPCAKDCGERCAGCKSTCERYQKILPKIKKAQMEYRKSKNADCMIRGFFKDQIMDAVYKR